MAYICFTGINKLLRNIYIYIYRCICTDDGLYIHHTDLSVTTIGVLPTDGGGNTQNTAAINNTGIYYMIEYNCKLIFF